MAVAQITQESMFGVSGTAVDAIRCKMRNAAEVQRHNKRHEVNDMLRCGLGEMIEDFEAISTQEIVDLSEKLRSRRTATCEDLFRLSRAFISDEQHIVAFMSTPGAFQVIIKELTGRRADRELLALQCICNLSLGKAKICEKIVAYAGSYLSVILEGGSYEMKSIALWTLANIISTSGRCAKNLININLITILLDLYVNTYTSFADVSSDAGLCLYLLALNGASYINAEHKCVIYKTFNLKNPYTEGAEYLLAILLHAGFFEKDCVIHEHKLIYLVIFIVNNINDSDNLLEKTNRLRVFYSIRALGNLIQMNPVTFTILKEELSGNQLNDFYNFMQKLINFHDSFLNKEIEWVIEIIKSNFSEENQEISQIEELLNDTESVAME
ncbi:uncharacterized protein LOC119689057 [Teleopsis dalmanni]|uniref:uncharacterized protein LOC119689057 n=1 Tax=Teleopsis dalmanni TaxID=139649 RepID=UPI0018CE0C0E|nr:uncharacterized protein LOC119689057 [Teleopsis dalmanni]